MHSLSPTFRIKKKSVPAIQQMTKAEKEALQRTLPNSPSQSPRSSSKSVFSTIQFPMINSRYKKAAISTHLDHNSLLSDFMRDVQELREPFGGRIKPTLD